MEFKKKTIIWEENTEPPKNYYWIKPDNKVYEFDIEEGDWIESEEITYTPSNKTAGGYSMNETSEEVSSAITSYEDSQRAALATYIEQQQNNLQTYIDQQNAAVEAGTITQEEADANIAAKTATIEKNIENRTNTVNKNIANGAITMDYTAEEEMPETITLPETDHAITVKGDFTQNETTTIECNGKIEKVSVNNTGEAANVVIDLPKSSVTLAGSYNEVAVNAVSNNTLKVAVGCRIEKLILKKGTVAVDNAYIEDNIKEYDVRRGTIKANDPFEMTAENATSSKFTASPRIVKLMDDVSVGNLAFGTFASGHYVWDFNGHKVQITRPGYGGTLLRSKLILDFIGEGEFIQSGETAVVWTSNPDAVVNIYAGKFDAKDHTECLYSEKGTINVYGGEFHNNCPEGQKNFLLNCKDANYQAGTAKIVVYGGKFYGFDPAHNGAESSDNSTNFVAEGYTSVDRGEYFEVIKDE